MQNNSVNMNEGGVPLAGTPNKKKGMFKKKKVNESRNMLQQQHNKPPLLLLQTLKTRPETAKHKDSINQGLKDSFLNNNNILGSSQNITNINTHYNNTNAFAPQQIVSELESVATPHKSCQTCSKINNYMTNAHQRSMRDYSPNENHMDDNSNPHHIISINNQIEDHNEDLSNLKQDLNQRQYLTLNNMSDSNGFFKHRTFTPQKGLRLSSNEKLKQKKKSSKNTADFTEKIQKICQEQKNVKINRIHKVFRKCEEQKKDIVNFQGQRQEHLLRQSTKDDEVQLQLHSMQRKIESASKEIDLIQQKQEHSAKQIDSLRNKEFYNQTNENTLLDKMHTLEQQLRTLKQQTHTQLQSLDDKSQQSIQVLNDGFKTSLRDVNKTLYQKIFDSLKEESQNNVQNVNDQISTKLNQLGKKMEQQKKEQFDAIATAQKNIREETQQFIKHDKIEKLEKSFTDKTKEVKDQITEMINLRLSQQPRDLSSNQIDEKIEQLQSKISTDLNQQKQQILNLVNQQQKELSNITKVVQEVESHQELLFNTLQKRLQLEIKEMITQRDESQKEYFESEKQDFLKAIQDNMLMLDSMLKEYALIKNQQQHQRQNLSASPQGIIEPMQSLQSADSYNRFLQHQNPTSECDNSILRSSVSQSGLNSALNGPFQELQREESKRYSQASRSRQQNIMVQDFMKSSESLANNNKVQSVSSDQTRKQYPKGIDNIPMNINEKEASKFVSKANSDDYSNRNDNQYEEVKVEDIEIYSPLNKKNKSESVHSASGSYSESQRLDGIQQNRVKRQKSSKTSQRTVEKTTSDFFNLTQESQFDLVNQFSNSGQNALSNIIRQQQQIQGQNQQPLHSIEKRFGKIGQEILEEVYVNEVLTALEECFGVLNRGPDQNSQQLLSNQNNLPSNNNLYLYERIETLNSRQNLNQGQNNRRSNEDQEDDEEDEAIDVALASHDYSDRYELSISNND
ncbi:UNKNOWN [Stylonychia lemnae]|uniref:Uncharacterized protein n=1 Tax=Stylonychia lemnae TaxID=5949 RepID=A0A078APZ3_STYLE|nr:UNKNOWN [Stylonychia lemnae]|eukprot:CDW84046.1 UNKNOWN [Stylonychia lemnae]